MRLTKRVRDQIMNAVFRAGDDQIREADKELRRELAEFCNALLPPTVQLAIKAAPEYVNQRTFSFRKNSDGFGGYHITLHGTRDDEHVFNAAVDVTPALSSKIDAILKQRLENSQLGKQVHRTTELFSTAKALLVAHPELAPFVPTYDSAEAAESELAAALKAAGLVPAPSPETPKGGGDI